MHSPRTTERAGAVDPVLRTRPSSVTPSAALSGIWALLLIVFVVAALYFGRSVLVPIALATLITFLLSRLVTRLERWIGRIAAVLVTVIAVFTIFAAASWVGKATSNHNVDSAHSVKRVARCRADGTGHGYPAYACRRSVASHAKYTRILCTHQKKAISPSAQGHLNRAGL